MYMRTILFTNARDEDNILEWTVHHKNLGFDIIYIYDHKSIYPISKTLEGLEYVIVTNISDDFIPKIELMKRASTYAKENGYDWLMYLDADEFLALPLFPNVQSFINNYPNNQQICVNWVMFGSNFLKEGPKGTMLENYIRSSNQIYDCVKCFVRPEKVLDVVNPHYFIVENMDLSSGVFGHKQYHIQPAICFFGRDIPLDTMPAYIAHYIFQAYDIYIKRKVNRKRDDVGTNYEHSYTEEELHKNYNDHEVTQLRDLYNNRNKILMNIKFNPSTYKKLNHDLNHMSDYEVMDHYIHYGMNEQRKYKEYNHSIFNPDIYKNLYDDLKHITDDEALQHYITYGIYEKRRFNQNEDSIFNPEIYKNLYDDLKHITDDEAYQHYVKYGIYEKRIIYIT